MYKSGKENRGLFCSLLRFYVSGCGLKSPALIFSYDPNRLTAGGVRMTLARHMPYGQSSEKFATLHKTSLSQQLGSGFFLGPSPSAKKKTVILYESVQHLKLILLMHL